MLFLISTDFERIGIRSVPTLPEKKVIWDPTGPYMSIGVYAGPNRAIQDHKGSKGILWDQRRPFGTIGDSMGRYRTIWNST